MPTPGKLAGAARNYLGRITEIGPSALRITDKLPINFLHLGLISTLFPRAHVIHCIRDPLDTCLSCFMQNFGSKLEFTRDLRHLGVFYREYERLMAHWHDVLPIQMMDVQYEEFVEGPEASSRRLIEFVGLNWDDACLPDRWNPSAVRTASQFQVRQKISTSAIGKAKHYEPWLGPLKEELAKGTEGKAG